MLLLASRVAEGRHYRGYPKDPTCKTGTWGTRHRSSHDPSLRSG